MVGQLITRNVDIFQCPAPEKHEAVSEITFGDLHGNALNLLHSLLRHGICELPKENYDRIVDIYCLPEWKLTSESIAEFNQLISSLKVINQEVFVRFLGDELGDRGQNDYFVLKMLEIIHQNDLKFEILLSNHGIAFVDAYESYDKTGVFDSELIVYFQRISLRNLDSLIQRGIVFLDEIYRIINRHYKPHLKLLSCSLDKYGKEITIFSHAKIDLSVIEALADLFEVVYREDSPQELALTIQQINLNFSKAVLEEKVNFISSIKHRSWKFHNTHSNPVEFLIWNRNHEILDRPANHTLYSYRLKFIHGHDSTEEPYEHLVTLDSMLGKGENYHIEEARDYLSNDVQILSYTSSSRGDRDFSFESDKDSVCFTDKSSSEDEEASGVDKEENSDEQRSSSRQDFRSYSRFFDDNTHVEAFFEEEAELSFKAFKF
ncbi:Dot/Icm T4SS effector Wip [Legionella yabuuchiae]|uniref:Dot/Icm T4SS effector Wip n=1 Tax=Legionella yabuuchiae TaxID=376727 RepID=UPI00105530A9|nr:Dot/Icm T4SS effector Wip [Legionella yabuuchiae]